MCLLLIFKMLSRAVAAVSNGVMCSEIDECLRFHTAFLDVLVSRCVVPGADEAQKHVSNDCCRTGLDTNITSIFAYTCRKFTWGECSLQRRNPTPTL